MTTNRRSFLSGLVAASIGARPAAALLSDPPSMARAVIDRTEERLVPRVVLMARNIGSEAWNEAWERAADVEIPSEAWQEVAECVFEHGDYVTATFTALRECALEFKAHCEMPGLPDYPFPFKGTDDGRYRLHLNAGDTVTADCGRLRVV